MSAASPGSAEPGEGRMNSARRQAGRPAPLDWRRQCFVGRASWPAFLLATPAQPLAAAPPLQVTIGVRMSASISISPKFLPVLDPGFVPACLWNRGFRAQVDRKSAVEGTNGE